MYPIHKIGHLLWMMIMEVKVYWKAGKTILWCLFLRCISLVLGVFIRRKSDVWLFLGRGGQFFDNTKYLSLWIASHVKEPPSLLYIHDMSTPPDILNIQFIRRGTLAERMALLRAGVIVVDEVEQIIVRRLILFVGKAKLVQLWHGAFLKKQMELILHHTRLKRMSPLRRILLKFQTWAEKRFPKYDFFVSTSNYYTEQVFKLAFEAKYFLNSGYPRNDLLLAPEAFKQEYILSEEYSHELFHHIERLRGHGKKVALYAPTWRRQDGKFQESMGVTEDILSLHARVSGCLWLVKPHPWDTSWQKQSSSDNVIFLNGSLDIYPFFHLVDVLVTDYSSISYDFLLVDRPIVFFAYDRHEYIDKNDNLMFDYDERTPGLKVYNAEELFTEVDRCFRLDEDIWRAERLRIRSLVFDNLAPTASQIIYDSVQHSL